MPSNYCDTARVKLLLNHPFFGFLACHLTEKDAKADNIPVDTCATDGQHLYVNPDFFNKLTEGEKVMVLAHEVLHCALGHVWLERRGTRDAQKWNMAADYVINLILEQEVHRIANEPKNIYGQKGVQMEMAKDCLLDHKYKDMSAEEVYDTLPQNIKIKIPMSDLRPDLGQGQGQEQGGNGNDKKGQGKGMKVKGGKSSPGHDQGKDRVAGEAEGESKNQKDLAAAWKEHVVQAATVARMQGKMPAGIERMIDDLIAPQIPWIAILERFVNDSMKDDYDWMRRDRRFIGRGLYLPDLYSESAKIAVAVDTSGSISQEELKEAVSEVFGILRSKKISKVHLMSCDAKVHLDKSLSPYDELPNEYPGGGGTDFRPVFEAIGNQDRPACLIYFTDTYGDFPEMPPPYPVLWVTKTKDFVPPFGMAIQMQDFQYAQKQDQGRSI
jgi:predicted metal-dependent peptidase